ncbi:MAG TPA: arginine repressor [Blastocatellia bacterium]|nr:arginine repressor [Blastocatellia bacterium]
MKRGRQQKILDIISAKRIATQHQLSAELARHGHAATQSSVSRDIVELGLTKADGYYAAPRAALPVGGMISDLDTAGDNLIVVRTDVGQAQPAAIAIDNAGINEIVGTVAGDDTILVAVKNSAAQRLAIRKLVKLFTRPAARARRTTQRKVRPSAHVPSHK